MLKVYQWYTTTILSQQILDIHELKKKRACAGGSGDRVCPLCGRPGCDPWVEKIPWKRAWQPTPVFLPGESPWTEEPGGLQSTRSQGVEHD